MNKTNSILTRQKAALAMALCVLLSSCVGAVVGAAVDTSIEVAKLPFKVVAAAADLAMADDEDN